MEKVIVEIQRVYLPDRVLGSLYINGKFVVKTLERPWLNNKRGISCIPEGEYDVIKQPPKPDRPYSYFRLPNVAGRSGILIHRGIKPDHSKGCILVGMRFVHAGNDAWNLENSTDALNLLMSQLPDKFRMNITRKKEGA